MEGNKRLRTAGSHIIIASSPHSNTLISNLYHNIAFSSTKEMCSSRVDSLDYCFGNSFKCFCKKKHGFEIFPVLILLRGL